MKRIKVGLLSLLAVTGGWLGASRSRAEDSAGAVLSTSDISSAVNSAWLAFLAGHLDEAASSFRYLATLGATSPPPDINLALLARDQGRVAEALPYFVKSSLEESAGGFVWNQRGWAYAALERLPEARESFLKAIDRSSTTADQAEARLGLGAVSRIGAQPRQALPPLREALVLGPFIMGAASYETAKASLSLGDKYAAIAYFKQCVSVDPLNLECLKELAALQAGIGENRSAWYSYLRLAGLDRSDKEAARQTEKLKAYLPGNPEDSLPVRRLTRPLLPEEPEAGEEPAPAAPALRVGLYTAPDGKPATAARIYFICNSDFKIVAASGDVVHDDGKGQHQWEVTFRPENNLVELRDNSRNIRYTSKQSFRIVPTGHQGSVLVKNAVFKDGVGVDIGDRELRGSLDIIPNPYGFKLVNEVPLEEYLYGVVSAALPHGSPSEAYKAQAVTARTRALWNKAHRPENLERMDICDSAACQRYMGLSEEMREAADAVRATRGIYLSREGEVAMVLQHDNCGGITEDGGGMGAPHLTSVSDGDKPIAATRSADQLELWTHEYPPADRYCEASGLTPPVESRWMRVIPASDLARRAETVRYIGAIRHIRAAKRAASGRILALEVAGTKDNLLLAGEKAISDFLSPGSLRSTLFTIQPLMSGSKADSFILWGAGTGHGVGMCRAGALGQASMGRKWDSIIKHYFPNLRINKPLEKAPAAAPARTKAKPAAPGGRRKPKNPHWDRK